MDDTLYDGTGLTPSGESTAEEPGLEVPAGTLDERLTWVGASDDHDERRARADAVWDHEVAVSDGTTDLDELGRLLTYHVYREQNQAAVVADDGAQESPGLPASPDGAEPGDPALQTDGDGTSYEDAAPSGSAAETVTDGTQAVAVPPVTDAAETEPQTVEEPPAAPTEEPTPEPATPDSAQTT